METNGEIDQGKFLRIRVEGKEGYLKAFFNKNKTKDSDADFKGEGILVWVNQAKPEADEASVPRESGFARDSSPVRQTELPRQQQQRRW